MRRVTWVAACAPLGCFVGDAALGLPCERDDDCGTDLRCVEGFCGGAPGTTSSTSNASAEDPSSESTGSPSMCKVDPPQCIPEAEGQPDADCNGDCTSPKCGDGYWNVEALNDVLNDGSTEQCDMGVQGDRVDHALCDADCTIPECGDGDFNPEADAIEECDDGDDDDLDGCTVGCREPAFLERFDREPEGWTVEPYDLQAYSTWVPPKKPDGNPLWWPVDRGNTDITGWRWASGAYDSGGVPYYDSTQNEQYGYAGVTRLVSPPILVPAAPTGFATQLRFGHTLDVEPLACALAANEFGDGGRVWVRELGVDMPLQPVQEMAHVDLVDDCGGVNPPYQRPNPMIANGDGTAFSGRMQSDPAEAFDLTAYAGSTVQLVFEFGTDCKYCPAVRSERESSRWRIDDVVVAPFPE